MMTLQNKNSPEDLKWVYNMAVKKADKHEIKGVTYEMTIGILNVT